MSFPGGLFNVNSTGTLSNRTVNFNIDITNVVTNAVIHDTFSITGGSTPAKSARARAVHVTLARAPGHIALTIADNGAGMEMAEADKACAFGLRGIRDRMDTLGGTLCIDSAPGSGTTLSLLIPTAQTTPA